MVLKVNINDGRKTTSTIRRDVKPSQLGSVRESFFASRHWAKWGELIQLKGDDERLIASF